MGSPAAEGSDADARDAAAAARGDAEAFGALFARLAPAAWGFARRLTADRAAAEDAVHDAFLRLLETARRGRIDVARGTVRGLLLRMVRNASVDAGRVRRRETGAPGPEDGGAFADPADLRADVAAALAALPPNHRAALLLRVDQGLPYEEIGVVLDVGVAQVRNWIHRARAALAERLAHPALAHGDRHV
ncbi:MAG TPA: RNA polymerase sigma factor [Planctomycetota bacterium]|nr:RNA polymerase sigma factor [Planctomycetota bacterium]